MTSDCPICYESINPAKNCVTTECGHSFHTSCLLKHTAFNGYGCPYCRTELATKKDVDVDPDDEDPYRMREVEADDALRETAEREVADQYDQYVLDGCRWMFLRANNEDIYDTDPYTDAYERWQIQMDENCRNFEIEMERKTDLIMKELAKINAFSYEDLVKGYLFWNQAHFCDSAQFEFHNRKVTNTLKSVVEKLDYSIELNHLR